jgi:hypothetical protein
MYLPMPDESRSTNLYPGLEPLTLKYRVESVTETEGRHTTIFVQEESEAPEDGFRLFFRNRPLSLERVVRLQGGQERILLENPGTIQWRPVLGLEEFLWEFPVFPLSVGSRRGTGLVLWGAEVEETIEPEDSGLTVTWTLDLELNAFEAVQVWSRSSPWFERLELRQIDPDTGERILYAFAELME